MEDKLLVISCRRGSKEALARIYEKYKTDMLVLAIALLNDKNVAEDVMHDVFLSFAENIEKFSLTGSLKGYLLTCLTNRARNLNKAKQQQSAKSESAEPFSSGSDEPLQAIICNEQLQQLSSAMAQLPYEQREVIMLHFQAEMSLRTIGSSLGISANTAKSRYRYGLEKLRSVFNIEAKNGTSR
ncbi:MAG: RNA polymerase sigma factor [Planctomycetota bacterium]|jgi:RNA polymerase sigma-70 factor (ECF subfamily)